MTLRPLELLLVAEEAGEVLRGRSVQKVIQPDARTVLLGFARALLLISVDARHGRLHLLDEKPPGTGQSPPAFCMLLRKHLLSARLTAITAVPGERAVELSFVRSAHDRDAQQDAALLHMRLLAFFYGAGGRIVLVDPEGRELGATGARIGPHELPPPRIDDRGSRFSPPDISAQIANHFESELTAARTAAARNEALSATRREAARLRRLVEQLSRDLAHSDNADRLRHHADLLLAHLHEIPHGAASVTLSDDFQDGEPCTIQLDPARSASDNAARLYRDYRRRQRGRTVVIERLAHATAELQRCEHRLDALAAGTLQAAAPPAQPAPKTPRSKRAANAPARPPYHLYRSLQGDEILVGRGAAKNDELTFHVARGDDLWLHARDVPGAHVVVPLGGRPVSQETLLDAATLAVFHSSAREERQADVTYCPRKALRKPRGAAPGKVSIAGGKTLRLRVEPERLARLLASRDPTHES